MAVEYKDYYRVLDVPKNAPQEQIRKAFRTLARRYHPDVARDKKAAEAKFKEINEAYEVLGDPEKRKKYDELGPGWANGGPQRQSPRTQGDPFGPGSFGGEGFSDFFEAFFRSSDGHGTARRRRVPPDTMRPQKRDLEAKVEVSIEDMLHGGRRRVTVRRGASVPPEVLEVAIPRGVRPGQKIRLGGKGIAGGDVLLSVSVLAHSDYKLEGDDLVREVAIPAWTAVLGGEVQVETPGGVVRMKVPAGSQPGGRLRMRGRGLPRAEGENGDFLVELKVQLPQALDAEAEALWKKLRALEGGA